MFATKANSRLTYGVSSLGSYLFITVYCLSVWILLEGNAQKLSNDVGIQAHDLLVMP